MLLCSDLFFGSCHSFYPVFKLLLLLTSTLVMLLTLSLLPAQNFPITCCSFSFFLHCIKQTPKVLKKSNPPRPHDTTHITYRRGVSAPLFLVFLAHARNSSCVFDPRPTKLRRCPQASSYFFICARPACAALDRLAGWRLPLGDLKRPCRLCSSVASSPSVLRYAR